MPAIAYWYLEEHYPLRIAIAGGLILAILELLLEKVFIKKVHMISVFNFALIAFLGGLSLLGDEDVWFKLQPCFTGIGIGLFLGIQHLRGKSLMLEMMNEEQRTKVPVSLITTMEKHLAFLFFFYGIFMGYTAIKMSTDQWLFFKTIGFYIAFVIFMVGEFAYLRFKRA